MGPSRQVQRDGSKLNSLNRIVQIYRSKNIGPNSWVQIDGSK